MLADAYTDSRLGKRIGAMAEQTSLRDSPPKNAGAGLITLHVCLPGGCKVYF